MDKTNKKLLRDALIWATCAALILPGLSTKLAVRTYTVTGGLSAPVRLCLITDLHSCRYGEREAELIAAIEAAEPDVILLGGDICDDKIPDDNTKYLLQGIAGRWPCLHVTGNHEYWAGKERFEQHRALLERYGVRILSGETERLTVRGQELAVSGVDDPESRLVNPMTWQELGAAVRDGAQADARTARFFRQLADVSAETTGEPFRILLSHRPEFFDAYVEAGFSLVLCGHAHGGQWRIPGVLNGVYAPGQGVFPKHAGGAYTAGGTTMIVSRGLARESTRIPRFYNRPELVIVDVR